MRDNFWKESNAVSSPVDVIEGAETADVAIVGGGFTGLWCAYHLLTRSPALKVVILEAGLVGDGPSGRNGGWFSDNFGVSLPRLGELFGREMAVECVRTLRENVVEVNNILARHDAGDCVLGHGLVKLARNAGQLTRLNGYLRDRIELGLGDGLTVLENGKLTDRVRVTGAVKGILNENAVILDPYKTVTRLKQIVIDMGARVYEHSRVSRHEAGPEHVLTTATGKVTAGKVVVCVETGINEFLKNSRRIAPIYSMVVLTEPLPSEVWESIGWSGRWGLSSFSYLVDYVTRTADDRILFGGRGSYKYGSRLDTALEHDERVWPELKAGLHSWFPATKTYSVTHQWGGAIGVTRDWLPRYRYDSRAGFGSVYGHGGQGMGGSFLGAKVLAEAVLGVDGPLASLPMATAGERFWEPEPLRWTGVNVVRRSMYAADRRDTRPSRLRDKASVGLRLGRQ